MRRWRTIWHGPCPGVASAFRPRGADDREPHDILVEVTRAVEVPGREPDVRKPLNVTRRSSLSRERPCLCCFAPFQPLPRQARGRSVSGGGQWSQAVPGDGDVLIRAPAGRAEKFLDVKLGQYPSEPPVDSASRSALEVAGAHTRDGGGPDASSVDNARTAALPSATPGLGGAQAPGASTQASTSTSYNRGSVTTVQCGATPPWFCGQFRTLPSDGARRSCSHSRPATSPPSGPPRCGR
jgi:hypothetical protein